MQLAPVSTTKSLSSGFVVDGKFHTSVGEKNVALPFSSSFFDVFGKSLRVSAGASLLSFSLLLRSVLKFHRAGIALMRNFDLYFIQQWTFVSRMFA